MHQPIRRRALLAALAAPAPAWAQAEPWPQRPVRIIVPFTPGGSNDAVARPLCEQLHARFGQPFIVENRPGAGSAVGVGLLAQSPPDGYTLLVTTSSIAAIGPVQGTGFDPAAELEAVALLAQSPLVVLTRPELPDQFHRCPGPGRPRAAGPAALRQLRPRQHDAYRLGVVQPAVRDAAAARALSRHRPGVDGSGRRAGRRDVHHHRQRRRPDQGRAAADHRLYRGGQAGRDAGRPDRPCRAESTTKAASGGACLPRAACRPPLRQILNAATNAALADPGFARYLAGEGATPAPLPPEAFTDFLRAEVAAMRAVAAAARIRAD